MGFPSWTKLSRFVLFHALALFLRKEPRIIGKCSPVDFVALAAELAADIGFTLALKDGSTQATSSWQERAWAADHL